VDKKSIPESLAEYDYPPSGKNYGQSFLCISMDGDQFDLVGEQLMYNQITVYRRNIPKMFVTKFPILTNAAKQKHIKQAPFVSKVILRSSGSTTFLSFAKSNKWQKGKHIWHLYILMYVIFAIFYTYNYANIFFEMTHALKINFFCY
jgi:hypothetical protein